MQQEEATAFVLGPQGFLEYARHDYWEPEWLTSDGEVEVDWSAAPVGDGTREMLPQVAALLRRIVAGAPVHVVPRLPMTAVRLAHRPGDAGVTEWGGFAFYGSRTILLSADVGPWSLLRTALHEAWHLVEGRMGEQDFALVRASVASGMPLPDGYYDSPVERSARAFESSALYQLSRSLARRMPPFARGARPVERIYWEVLTGTYRYLPARPLSVVSPPQPGILRQLAQGYADDMRAAAHWLAGAFPRLGMKAITKDNRRTA